MKHFINSTCKLIAIGFAAAFSCATASAQETEKSTMFNGSTNLQIFYDFGKDRKCATTTVEGFYNDPWGNTFFFIDHDYPTKKTNDANKSITGSYWEIARCLNFWQKSKVNFLSLHVEYNGGAYRAYDIKHSFLAGADFFVHSQDFRNTFNFKLLYKGIVGQDDPMYTDWTLPMQFTFVWGMQDIFNVKGLRFSGFADFWGEKHFLYSDNDGDPLASPEQSNFVFLSEPQLWYSVGQHFGCPNLNVGGELELSYDFGSSKGFWCRPCLGVKWVF